MNTLQVYLDEYTFRSNRRGTPMAAYQTLLGLGSHQPDDLPSLRLVQAPPSAQRS